MQSRPESELRRSPSYLLVPTFLTAGALLSLAFRLRSSLFEFPLTEDGYYLLAVSRNVAMGHGITIDGRQLTNGFQPLFAFLMVPVYALTGGGRLESLRGVLAMHWLMHALTALLLAGGVRQSLRAHAPERAELAGWATACLWLGSRYVILNSYSGLETGCVLMLYATAWRLYQADWLTGWRLFAFSGVLGLLVLARIDAAIFVAILAAFELLRSGSPLRSRILRAATMSGGALVVSLPWWLFNVTSFGSLMPSSGTAQMAPFSLARIAAMVQGVMLDLVPYMQIRWIQGAPQLIVQGLLLIGVAFIFFRDVFPMIQGSLAARFAAALFTTAIVFCAYYLLTSGAGHFYGRYLSVLMLLSVPVTAIALFGSPRLPKPVGGACVLAVLAIALLSVAGFHLQRGVAKSPFYNDQLQLILSNVPAGDVVGAGQSGTIGYFRERVVNLDGKVNSAAIPFRDRMWVYLEQQHIEWFCDWTTKWLGPDPAAHGWQFVAKRGDFLLYRHRPPS